LLFGGILAQAPFFMASSLIQSASQPRSASSIDPDLRQQFSGKSNVVRLARAQRKPYRQTIAIDYRINLARQATA
jgi:hypothetical protein